MTTTVSPSRVRGVLSSRSSCIRTPACRHLRTTSRCQSTVNHSTTAWAITAPTPSTEASCSSEAASTASSDPSDWASARAALGPTCRIDSATSTRQSGWSFTRSRFSSSFWPLADSSPSLRV